MDNLDFSEEEIEEQLAILGYSNIPKHRLHEFKQELDELIRSGEWKTLASPTQTDATKPPPASAQPSPLAYTKEKVGHSYFQGSDVGFVLPLSKTVHGSQQHTTSQNRRCDQQQQNYDSYARHSVAPKLQLPSGAPSRLLRVEPDPEDSFHPSFTDSYTSPPDSQGRRLIKRKVLRKHEGQSLVFDESFYSEDSALCLHVSLHSPRHREDSNMYKMYNAQWDEGSEDDKSSLNSSFWSDEEKQQQQEEEEEVEIERVVDEEESKVVAKKEEATLKKENGTSDEEGGGLKRVVEEDKSKPVEEALESSLEEKPDTKKQENFTRESSEDEEKEGSNDEEDAGKATEQEEEESFQEEEEEDNQENFTGESSEDGREEEEEEGSNDEEEEGESTEQEEEGSFQENFTGVSSEDGREEKEGNDEEEQEEEEESKCVDEAVESSQEASEEKLTDTNNQESSEDESDEEIYEEEEEADDEEDGSDEESEKDEEEIKQVVNKEESKTVAETEDFLQEASEEKTPELKKPENVTTESCEDASDEEEEEEEEELEQVANDNVSKPVAETEDFFQEASEEETPELKKQEDFTTERSKCGGDDDEEKKKDEEEGNVSSSCSSPAQSLMTSGYGTYRPEEQEGADYRDDHTITEFDQDSRGDDEEDGRSLNSFGEFEAESTHEQGHAETRPESEMEIEDKSEPGAGGVACSSHEAVDVTKVETQENVENVEAPHEDSGNPDVSDERWEGQQHVAENRDEEWDVKPETEAEEDEDEDPDESLSNKDIKFIDSKVDFSWMAYDDMEWEGNLRQKKDAANCLEDRLAELHVSSSTQGDSETEKGDVSGHSYDEDRISLSAFESYISSMTESQSDLRPKPKSFIRPVMNQQSVKKTDPVAKYFQYKQFWEAFKLPGERDRRALRLEIRERLAHEPPPKPRRILVPNTYIVPTEKKRSALRWEIRSHLAQGLLPHKFND